MNLVRRPVDAVALWRFQQPTSARLRGALVGPSGGIIRLACPHLWKTRRFPRIFRLTSPQARYPGDIAASILQDSPSDPSATCLRWAANRALPSRRPLALTFTFLLFTCYSCYIRCYFILRPGGAYDY